MATFYDLIKWIVNKLFLHYEYLCKLQLYSGFPALSRRSEAASLHKIQFLQIWIAWLSNLWFVNMLLALHSFMYEDMCHFWYQYRVSHWIWRLCNPTLYLEEQYIYVNISVVSRRRIQTFLAQSLMFEASVCYRLNAAYKKHFPNVIFS